MVGCDFLAPFHTKKTSPRTISDALKELQLAQQINAARIARCSLSTTMLYPRNFRLTQFKGQLLLEHPHLPNFVGRLSYYFDLIALSTMTIVDYSHRDILCVQSMTKKEKNHYGNQRFRNIIQKHAKNYQTARKWEHKFMCVEILTEIQSEGFVRFLTKRKTKDEQNVEWEELDTIQVRKKVINALMQTKITSVHTQLAESNARCSALEAELNKLKTATLASKGESVRGGMVQPKMNDDADLGVFLISQNKSNDAVADSEIRPNREKKAKKEVQGSDVGEDGGSNECVLSSKSDAEVSQSIPKNSGEFNDRIKKKKMSNKYVGTDKLNCKRRDMSTHVEPVTAVATTKTTPPSPVEHFKALECFQPSTALAEDHEMARKSTESFNNTTFVAYPPEELLFRNNMALMVAAVDALR
jgi:hypothetical protein